MAHLDMITIVGPTATGKTRFAAMLAKRINAEIISADSRQVYRRMSIGTGKDFRDYVVDGVSIPFHLIDICEPGYHYNLFEFQSDFLKSWQQIKASGNQVILCGGTGMYLDAVLKGYEIIEVPVNEALRKSLGAKSHEELSEILSSMKTMHNVSDTSSRQRLIRAIEIERFREDQEAVRNTYPSLKSLVIGLSADRETRRTRITNRLSCRLQEGMIDEVESLLREGLTPEELIFYGLEYKYITLYLTGQIDHDEMVKRLNIAIHQFAKRQMTWFRKMEREGIQIHWIDSSMEKEDMVTIALELIGKYS